MKLATLRDRSRDGRLVVVSRDLTRCSDARHLAPTLQAALDAWDEVAPGFELIARGIESGGQPVGRFHEREARAPLPRAYQWLGAADFRNGSGFADPRSPIRSDGARDLDSRAGLAALTADVPRGADRAAASAAIRLVLLVNDLGDRASAALSPVAVTPDELGGAGVLTLEVNGAPLGRLDAGMSPELAERIAEGARTRPLAAGCLVTCEPVSRAGLRCGDTVRIEMRDASHRSIFGAIEQTVEPDA